MNIIEIFLSPGLGIVIAFVTLFWILTRKKSKPVRKVLNKNLSFTYKPTDE